MFTKVGRSLDLKNIEIASLKAQITHLITELEASKPRTRKRVYEDGNERFARIEDIAKAQKASQIPPKRKKTARAESQPHAVEEAREIIARGLEQYRQAEEED